MVNGLHLYSVFIQSAVQFMPLIHPFTHTFTHQRRLAAMQGTKPARQEQLGVRCLAQGHFDMPRVGSNWQPSDYQTTALTSWATSPRHYMCPSCQICPLGGVSLHLPPQAQQLFWTVHDLSGQYIFRVQPGLILYGYMEGPPCPPHPGLYLPYTFPHHLAKITAGTNFFFLSQPAECPGLKTQPNVTL